MLERVCSALREKVWEKSEGFGRWRGKDAEFFEAAPGLSEPWRVGEIKMDMNSDTVQVIIECRAGTIWAEDGERLHIHGW